MSMKPKTIYMDKYLHAAIGQERLMELSEPEFYRVPYIANLVQILNGFALRHFSNEEYSLQWLQTALEANRTLYWNDYEDMSESLTRGD